MLLLNSRSWKEAIEEIKTFPSSKVVAREWKEFDGVGKVGT